MTSNSCSSLSVFNGLLSASNLRYKNLAVVEDKLKRLVEDGHRKLQVLADFDFTLSSFQLPDGSRANSTHAVLENDETKKLLKHYLRIEYDPELTPEQKTPHMMQWWSESHVEMCKENHTRESLRHRVKNATELILRAGFAEFFAVLEKFDVPIVIFSGGIGDIIEIVIEENLGRLPKNVHIISNWMIYDSKGYVTGFKDPIVHSFNKNGSVIEKEDSKFFDNLRSRPNIFLMGDSLGDASMDVGLKEEQTVFKLGFLNFSVEKSMDDYLNAFDIVCVKDETLHSPLSILSAVFSCPSDERILKSS